MELKCGTVGKRKRKKGRDGDGDGGEGERPLAVWDAAPGLLPWVSADGGTGSSLGGHPQEVLGHT